MSQPNNEEILEEPLSEEERTTILEAFRNNSATESFETMYDHTEVLKHQIAILIKRAKEDDIELILQILQAYGYSSLFDYLPDSFKQLKEFQQGVANLNPKYIRFLPRVEDVEIWRQVLKRLKRKEWDTVHDLHKIPESVLEDKIIAKKIAQKFPMHIGLFPKLCNDVKLIRIAIGSDGRAIRYASINLMRSKEKRNLILTAVKNSRKSLYYLTDYIDSSFAKHPILSEAAFKNFSKRELCQYIPTHNEFEMRKLFREQFSRAVQSIGSSYKDPLTHRRNGLPLPEQQWEREWIDYCRDRLKPHLRYLHEQFFGHFSDVSLITVKKN